MASTHFASRVNSTLPFQDIESGRGGAPITKKLSYVWCQICRLSDGIQAVSDPLLGSGTAGTLEVSGLAKLIVGCLGALLRLLWLEARPLDRCIESVVGE